LARQHPLGHYWGLFFPSCSVQDDLICPDHFIISVDHVAQAEAVCEQASIVLNKNTIPGDKSRG
jgi:hypothetical protein